MPKEKTPKQAIQNSHQIPIEAEVFAEVLKRISEKLPDSADEPSQAKSTDLPVQEREEHAH